ncbi:MAG: flagellar protein FlgN [Candidatus Thiodiazotropha sp.]
MNDAANTQTAFAAILDNGIGQAQALLALLEQEYQLLLSPPSKALETLLTEKQRLLKRVEQGVVAHNRFLQQQGLSADRHGTESYLDTLDDSRELQAAWNRYLDLAAACRRQNEINGGAVELNQRQVSQALNILLGVNDGNKTYGRSGQSRPTNASNSLGKA